ncbi:neogenin [Aplysia californica]|uniref:Neogenin n=1 Tax=Aplysia californica TaxID=6500 RepID=A0ABM0JNB9_APLCA|nr:neogenin [Aplysia californica]
MKRLKICAVLVILLVFVALGAEAGKKRRRHRRCKYNKSGSKWSACDTTLHVKTKIAHLKRGKSSCPSMRTFTKPCNVGLILFNGCEYRQVSDWSECDTEMKTKTRTLELVSGDTRQCDNNRVESRECLENADSDDSQTNEGSKRERKGKGGRKKKMRKRKEKRRRKKARRRQKIRLKSTSDCIYEGGVWSECDPNTGLQTTVQKLNANSAPSQCEQTVAINRRCDSSSTLIMVQNAVSEQRRHDGENATRAKIPKRKKIGKKDKKRNKKKKDHREISEKPPRPAEIHVVPYTTFVMVTWTPPQPDPFGNEVPVTGYQIGYGRGFPDVDAVEVNASEFSYKIENLEPGREYVISVRAQNHMGAGQALYETVITRIPDGDEFKPIFPPVGLRAIVQSAHAINVTWMDMAMKQETAQTEEREYFLRYRQLNHMSSPATPHNRFQTLRTKYSYLVVDTLLPFTKYEFAVLASNTKQNSTWSMMVWNITREAVPSTPPEDLNVIIHPGSPGQVTLNWQPPTQANGIVTGYEVSYSTAAVDGQPLVGVMETKGNKLSVTLTSLVPGVTYDLSVKARNSRGLGPPFTIKDYKLPGDPSPVPASLAALPTAGNPTAVTLVWDLPGTANTNILGFVILYTSEMNIEHVHWEVESKIGKDLKTAVIENLEPGKEYFFKIQAHTSVGFGPESNTVAFQILHDEEEDVSTIEAPKKLQVIVLSSTSAVLSWQDPHLAKVFEDTSSPSPRYTVRYRSLDPEPSQFKLVSQPFTSLYLVDLQPLTRYEFSVRVHRGKEMSDWSVPVENTTFAADFSQHPLKAEVRGQRQSPGVVVLSWQPHSDSKIKEYIVMYSSDPSKPHKNWIQKAAVNQDVRQQLFYNLTPETTYYFFIQAMTDLGFGPRSKVVSYTTPKGDKSHHPASTVEKLRATVVSATSVVLSWHDRERHKLRDKDYDRALSGARYSVRYRAVADKSASYTYTNSTFTNLFIGSLRPATKYEFSVSAMHGGQMSSWSVAVTNTTTETAPDSAPSNLTALMDHGDPTTALLSWQPPPFPNGEITGYHLFYTTDIRRSLEEAESISVSGSVFSYPVSQLRPRTNYFFRVGAENKEGFGPLSEPIAYKTPRVRGSPPEDVTVVPSTDNPYDAIVSWQPPSSNSRKIKHYAISHQTEDGKSREVTTVPGSTLTTRISPLQSSTVYHFTVQAHYRRGAGPHSDVALYSIPKELISTQ